MLKRIVLNIIFLTLLIKVGYAQSDTISIYYEIGQYKLDESNYNKIQQKLDKLNDVITYRVEIISSCDFLGSNKTNLILSSQRAVTVRDLLQTKENISISAITYKGIGELATRQKNRSGVANHRKTTLIFKNETEIILNKLAKSKKGDVFVLRGIMFEPARHYLKKESIVILKKLLKIMFDNPKLEIELSGHVCCGKNKHDEFDAYDKDADTYNLSENRAKHIYKYLLLKKIDKSRLTHKGYGFKKPLIYPELTEFDKKMNRRVEIKIIKN